MPSIRERLLRELVTRLATAIAPVPVLRAPTVPVTRDASPALLLFPESDAITERPNARVDRLLTVRLVAIARGADGEAVADGLIVAAHAALTADANLGGLALGVQEVDCEWDAEDADAGAVALPARYAIRYRTVANDLSISG